MNSPAVSRPPSQVFPRLVSLPLENKIAQIVFLIGHCMSSVQNEGEGNGEDFVMGPFEAGYLIEAAIRAQTMCVLVGRDLLRQRIQREFISAAGVRNFAGEIFPSSIQDAISRLRDRDLWRLLKKDRIIDNHLHTSLQGFTTYRNELAHDVMGRLKYVIDEKKTVEIKEKLQEMLGNFEKLVDSVAGRTQE